MRKTIHDVIKWRIIGNQQFGGRHLWTRGYFIARSGNVTDEAIVEYIKNQDVTENMKSDNFNIDGF